MPLTPNAAIAANLLDISFSRYSAAHSPEQQTAAGGHDACEDDEERGAAVVVGRVGAGYAHGHAASGHGAKLGSVSSSRKTAVSDRFRRLTIQDGRLKAAFCVPSVRLARLAVSGSSAAGSASGGETDCFCILSWLSSAVHVCTAYTVSNKKRTTYKQLV